MCGIAGIFNYGEPDRAVDRALVARITQTLRHRGPDGEGVYVDGPVGLGNRRLAIVELSSAGAQPMTNEDGSYWITYNGEIYNHRRFRDRLSQRGHVFRGESDTETLLHLFEQDGMNGVAQLAGIFAFALWDRRQRRLVLVRDPLGVKQLYYHDDGHRIVFASEIKAVLACDDVERAVEPEAVNQYLHFHTPLFARTFFNRVGQLRPGEYMEISPQGVRRGRYWQVERFDPSGGSPEDKVERLREHLGAVVSEQLMSDVPVGVFFSGGIDSTAVAAFASARGHPLPCFGVHFSGQGVVDERPYQEAAAKALGLELHLMTLDGSDFPDELSRLLYIQDEPVIGSAMFPMYHVSRVAAKHVKVCLGGQGGDEVFGGYARYGLVRPWHVLRSGLAGRRQRTGGPPGRPAGDVGGNLWKQLAGIRTVWRLARALRHVTNWRARYFANVAKVPEKRWRAIFGSDEFVSRARCRDVFEQTISESPATDPGDQAMHWDMQTYLPGLFHQDDRMSMANSLESRVPLADPRLVEFAFRCGFDVKFRAGASKWILRRAVADVIPEEVLNRRKIGFDTPAENWMKTRHMDFVRDVLLSAKARWRGWWNPKGLEEILARGSDPLWFDIVWKALCIETWAQVFLDGTRSPD
jgi:asparagine synthase (glutamine-hydrolysing)